MRNYRQGIERDMELEKRVNAGRLRFEDCFLRGTLENAITWNNGGTKYHHIVVQGSGIATAADALYAIEALVFKEKVYTLSQLNDILKSDWEGQEALRQRILHLPKFGNDAEEVDKYATWVSEAFADAVAEQDQGRYLYGFLPTLSSDRDFTTMGRCVGATADGRICRAPISENQSPAEGADLSGVTALLNSVSKIRFDRITGGPLNLRLHPSAVQGEKGAHLLTALLTTYFQKGGLQIQMNVVDRDTLIRAQQEPEKYRNLCVRVTGYSAFFTQMGQRAQDEMIRRLPGVSAFGPPVARRHVDLATQNRPHAPRTRMVVEDDRREHVPVLGDGDRRHVQLRRLVQHLVDAAGAVEERKLGVKMQVNEIGHDHV
jgi:formate C-acetyltransferase